MDMFRRKGFLNIRMSDNSPSEWQHRGNMTAFLSVFWLCFNPDIVVSDEIGNDRSSTIALFFSLPLPSYLSYSKSNIVVVVV